jgi:hypothetical protein
MKRAGAVLLAGLILSATPASASSPSPTVQVQDPVGDANFLTTPWAVASLGGPFVGDIVTPSDASGAADIMSAWYTQAPKGVVLNIRTESPTTAEAIPITYRMMANFDPYWDWANLFVRAVFDGERVVDAQVVDNSCSTEPVPTRALAKESRDGSGVVRIWLPESCLGGATEAVITGTTIATTLQPTEMVGTPLYDGHLSDFVTIDMTERGQDYVIKR